MRWPITSCTGELRRGDLAFLRAQLETQMDDSTAFIVEDFQPLRESMMGMLKLADIDCEAFASPAQLLESLDIHRKGCLVLDLHLAGMTGLELQKRLWESGCRMPFLIVSGRGQILDATTALRRGAVDFLEKPFSDDVFIDRVREAIGTDAARRRKQQLHAHTVSKLETLTSREHEVLELILDGQLTKQMARQLNISAKTVENHRSNIAKKMGVDSAVQLVRIVAEFLRRMIMRLDDFEF